MAEESNNGIELKYHDENSTTVVEAKNSRVELIDDDEKEAKCGCAPCGQGFYPTCIQICNDAKALLFVLSWIAFWQSFVCNGINNAVVSTLERRFELRSSEVAWISSAYDISAGLLAIPFSFIGDRKNKTRLVLIGTIFLCVGSVVYFLPHFTTGLYEMGQAEIDVCSAANSTNPATCPTSSSKLSNYLYVLILAQVLHGVGGTIIYTVGIAMLDDNTTDRQSGLYMGIYYSLAALGPALGFVLGGVFLGSYVDFDQRETPAGLTTDDPRWVGAWWLGACLSAAGFFLATFMILPFPPLLRGSHKLLQEKKSQTYKGKGDNVAVGNRQLKFKDLLHSTKLLLCNPTFLLVSVAGCFEGYVSSGFATYASKIVQNQFSVPASSAALYTGASVVAGIVFGYFFGGWFIKWRSLKVRGMLRFCIVVLCISLVMHPILFLRCDESPLAGVNVPYHNLSSASGLNSTCNGACGCDTSSYDPVCGADGVQYFTPCHAGCLDKLDTDPVKYINCSCIAVGSSADDSAEGGECSNNCTVKMIGFLATFFFLTLTMFSAQPVTLAITLRVVPQADKTYATGLQWVIVRFLGTIPGPVLSGVVVDKSCQIWQQIPGCDYNGSCWVYDNSKLALNLFLFALSLKIGTIVLYILAHVCYKAPSDTSVDESMNETNIKPEILKGDNPERKNSGDENRNMTKF